MGVIATSVALNLAKEANLDLVEVAPNAKPPVAKLIDYGKFKYNEKIKAREARRNQSTAEIKEIRFRLKIDDHDFDVKKGHVTRFLNGGDKVKVTIMLRGREISRPIGGVELLQCRAEGQEGPYPVRAASSWRRVPRRASGSPGGSSRGQAGVSGSGRGRRAVRDFSEDFRQEANQQGGQQCRR